MKKFSCPTIVTDGHAILVDLNCCISTPIGIVENKLAWLEGVSVFHRPVANVRAANNMVLNAITHVNVVLIVLMPTQVRRHVVLPQIWKDIGLQLLGWAMLRRGIHRVMASDNEIIC
jgi:hypothetical protein